jgi:hypothetical protein
MPSRTVAEIRSIANGFVVRVDDPEVRKANQDPKAPWQDPSKEYSFTTVEKALAWIKANIATLTADLDEDGDEFGASFKRATTEK